MPAVADPDELTENTSKKSIGGGKECRSQKTTKHRKKDFYKRSYLERSLKEEVLKNGIAYVPCRVSGMDDIISKFSVKGCESLDESFMNYVVSFTEFIPVDYPVVLEIIGPAFSPEEKKIISETIYYEMDYRLGKEESECRQKKNFFLFMMLGTVVSGVVLSIAIRYLNYNVPREFLYVIFWLFADSMVRYAFIEKVDMKEDRIQAGRLASMEVHFKEEAGS